MPRYAGLVDARLRDDVADLLLSGAKDFDDATASRICEGLENVKLHAYAYTLPCT